MFKTLSSRIVHKNPWFNISHERFEISKNKIGDYFLFNNLDASIIIPIKNDKIIFIKQFRFPTKKWSLELPCGGGEKNLNIRQNAIKELQEETGYRAKEIKNIGKFYPIPGRSGFSCSVFLATNLKFVGEKHEETECIKIVELSKKEAYKMVNRGEITDAFTLASLLIGKDKF